MKNEISTAGNLIKIIEDSRNNALKKVNEELIRMYWNVGEYLSKEAENAVFGDAYIDSVAKEIQEAFPGMDVVCDELSLGVSCHIGPGGLGIGCSCKPRRI